MVWILQEEVACAGPFRDNRHMGLKEENGNLLAQTAHSEEEHDDE